MLTVVTPTYCEAASIGPLLDALHAQGARVIVVDDGSPDGTARIAADRGATVLERPGKLGLGSAYVLGLTAALEAGGDPIDQLDADGSHDPADVPRLLAALDAGAGLALGSRYVPGGGTVAWGLHRRALSRFGTWYAAAWLGLEIRDLTGGFKAWRAATLRAIALPTLRSEGYAFQVETTWRAVQGGARVVEVPIVFTERAGGQSKMSAAIALEAARVVPALRWGHR